MIAITACAVTAFAEKSKSTKDTFDSSELSAWWINPSDGTKVDTENKWLAIEADKDTAVQRLYYEQGTEGQTEPVTIPANGMLYFDSSVKFTVSDNLTFEGGSDAKIGLWAYCKDDADGSPTNLVVCAGVKSNDSIVKKLFLTTTKIDANKFYRVTVKAMPIGSAFYGFGIYVDGEPVVIDTAADTETFAVATGFVSSDLNSTAQSYEANHALFPSLIYGVGRETLTAVGFIGTGIVDNVDFTDELPTDIPGDATTQAIAWEGSFKSITVTAGGKEYPLDLSGTSQNLEFEVGTTTFTIEAVPADGYAIVGSTVGEKNVGDEIKIEAYEIAFTVDGVPYKTFGDAVTAAISAGKPLVLAKSYSGDPLVIVGDLTLDLAGKTITTEDGEYAIVVNTDCQLTIVDSSEGSGCIETGSDGAIMAMGAVVIRGGKIAGLIEETATFFGGSVIKKGTEESFPYTLGDDTLGAELDEGYWVVGPKGAEKTPLQIFLEAIAAIDGEGTVTLTENITLDAPVAISGKSVTINGEYTITANGRAFNVSNGAVLTVAADTTIKATGATCAIFLIPNTTGDDTYTESNASTATVNVYGTVIYDGTSTPAAIQDNGNSIYGDAIINVYDGGLVENKVDAAIYKPGKGSINISGGTVRGTYAGIQAKSGAINISGGQVIAAAADSTPTEPFNNGANPSGCALQLEGNGAYAGGVTLTVTGGELISQQAKAIYAYGAPEKIGAITVSGGKLTVVNTEKPAIEVVKGVTVKVSGDAELNGAELTTDFIDITPEEGFEKAWVAGATEGYVKAGTQKTASEEPTIPTEEGTIEKDQEGNYVVTPAQGTNTVDITNLPTNAKVIVPGSIDKINGLSEGAKVIVKNGDYDITDACTITEGTITLNSEAVVTVGTEQIPVKPAIAEEVMVDEEKVAPFNGTDTIAVKAIPGLKYTLVAGDEPGAVTTPASAPVTATGTGVKLVVDSAKFTAQGAKAFFKVQVSK